MSGVDARHAAAAALAALPGITAARLRRLLETFGDPVGAVDAVAGGRARRALRSNDPAAAQLAVAWARAVDVNAVRARLEQRRTRVWIAGDADYPIADPLPDLPAVLFGEGDAPEALAAPRVAIVGTRSATPHGLADARELGAFLAAAGVTVVSGLAIGIDGAAHEGALDAGGTAIGVVATGLDVVYPRRHNVLTQRVRGRGLLLTEYPFGVQPHRAQFPERNRIIAAAADVCVVVEATATGGARITAEHAVRYGRDVFALPGARRNPAAAGCNQLIADGAQILLDPGDLLIALGAGRADGFWRAHTEPEAEPDDQLVLAAFSGEAAGADDLLVRTGLAPDRLAGALRRLRQTGRVEQVRSRWWPR
jgi:DNA processing protein